MSTYLSGVLGQRVFPTFRIGPARANRKPVIRLLDSAGRTVAFAKIGISELTNSLVRAEAHALDAVARTKPQAYKAPEIIHHGQWRDLEVLVQAPLPIVSHQGAPDPKCVLAAMGELATGAGTERGQLLTSRFWNELRQAVDVRSDPTTKALAAELGRVEAGLTDVNLRFGAWHGDWTPWNMAAARDGILLWDWERYQTGVPVGFDALHCHFQRVKITMQREDALANLRSSAAALLRPLGVDRQSADVVAVLYAISLAVRYSRDLAAMGDRTWDFEGSPMLEPLTRFVADWAA